MKTTLLHCLRSCLLTLGALLAIASPASVQAADDHGNNATTATVVTLPATLNGNIEATGDTDWFKFTLAAPSVVTVVSGGTTDVVGHLLVGGARGTFTEVYADNDGAGAPNFRLSQLLPVGTHYVYVHGLNTAALGAYTVDFQVSAPPAAQPDISLLLGGTELAAGALVDYGSTATGTPVSKDITVANVGTADLRVYSIRTSIVGTMPTGAAYPWRVLASPGISVLAGRQSNLRLAFQPTVAGIYNTKVTVVSSDGDEILSEFNVRGVATGSLPTPEIAVRDGATDVPNNGAIGLGSTQTNTRLTRDITIANTGTGELKITGSSFVAVSTAAGTLAGATTPVVSGISLYNSTIPTAIPAGGQATFTVALFNLVAGSYATKITLYNNDADENPTTINLTGTVTPDPVQGEIGVSLAGANVLNNTIISYGNAFTGSPVSKDFVIANSGTGDLKITSWSLSIPPPNTVLVATTSVLGSPTATVASSASLAVGMAVSYPFPSGTTITAINGASITLSAAATSAITNANISYFTGGVASMVNAFRLESSVPTSIAPGASATVKLTYLPMQAGNHAAIFKAYNNDLDENPFSINLNGHADVNPNPGDIAVALNGADVVANSDVNWGAVPVGNTALKTFTITNTGTGELRLTGFQALPVQPVLTGTTPMYFYFGGTPSSVLAPGQSGSLIMVFKPAAAGVSYKSSLIISSTDPDENPYRFNLVGTGAATTAPAPEIEININGAATPNNGTFAFGSVNSGTLSQKSLLINNTGSAPLTITGMSVTPPLSSPAGTPNPFGLFSIAPTTIAPNSAYSLWLNFAPTSAGDFTGILQIASNDADENPYIVNVTGTGVGTVSSPEIDISLAGADVPANSVVPFGNTASGTPVSKQFTINNTGSAALNLSTWYLQYPNGSTIGVSTTTTVGSPTASVPASSSATIVPGMTVSGPFPVGTSVVSVAGTTVTFSAPALSAVTNFYIGYYLPGVPIVSPFRFDGTLPGTVAPGASATFTVTYAPMAAGNHTMIARFATNDLSENPFMFIVTGSATGVAPTPEIAVSVDGADAPQSSTVAYGSTATGTPVTKQFTISNTGPAALTLTGYGFFNPVPSIFVTAPTTTGSTTALLNTTSGVTAGMVVQGPFPIGTTIVSLAGNTATFSSGALSTSTSTGLSLFPAGTNTLNPFQFSGPLPGTIAPGATAPLTVVFAPQAAGSYSMNLRFNNNDADENPFQLTLTGSSVGSLPAPEIGVSLAGADVPIYSSVSYGSIMSGTTASKTYVISNTGNASLNLGGWSFFPSATGVNVSTSTTVGSPAATVASAAGLAPGMVVVGPFPAGTSIVSISGNLVTFSASATSTLVNTMLGYYPSGTSTLNPFRFDGAPPSTVAPGATASFTVTYAPTSVGNHSMYVKVSNNDGNENPYQFTITGSSTAAPSIPKLTINYAGSSISNNATVAFGTMSAGFATAKSIFLVNTGNAPLTISGLNFSLPSSTPAGLPNAFFSQATAPPITLAPNASYGITVSFAPNTAGDYNGQLQVTSNDPTQGVFNINLTGTGSNTAATPRISLSQGGVDVPQNGTVSYGSTTAGSLVSKQFTIANNGSAALTIYGISYVQPFGSNIGINTTTTAGSAVATVSSGTNIVAGMAVGLPFPIGTSVVSVAGATVNFSAPALNTTNNSILAYFQPGMPILNSFRLDGSFPSSIAAGATGTLTLTYAPLAAGNHSMIIALNNNDGSHGPVQFVVNGSATGVAPVPEISASTGGVDVPEGGTVSYPATTTGVGVTKQFVISNTGSANLNLSGWSFSNPAPVIFANASTTVGSASATLAGVYSGLSAGMVVSSSNLPLGTTVVSVAGTAITFSAPATGTSTSTFLNFYPAGTNTVNPFTFSGTLPSSIAPGANATISVVFNATVPGTYAQNLRVTTNDPDENPFQMTLTGTASGTPLIPDIAVFSGATSTAELAQNAVIDFGPVTRGNIVIKDLVIKNPGTSTLTYGYGYTTVQPTPAPATSAFYTYVAPVSSIAPGGVTTLRVAFKPMALSTAYSTKLVFNSNDPDESPLTLTLSGNSLATDSEIGITTGGVNVPNNGSMAFGDTVELGSTVTKTITISNTGDGPLAISGWAISPAITTTTFTAPSFTLGFLPTTIQPGASSDLTITYRPLAIGADNWVLSILNSDFDEGTYKIYLGGTAIASATPSEVNLSVDGVDIASGGTLALTTAVNVALTKDVLITNTGTGPLLIGAYWTTNAASTSMAITTTQGPPTSIPPGGSAVWKIRFLPTAAGSAYSTKLTLWNTDADEGAYVINVTGATTP